MAEAIYRHSLRLPDEAARTALDFVAFLEQRDGVKPADTASAQRPRREPGSARGKLVMVADDDHHLADDPAAMLTRSEWHDLEPPGPERPA